MVADIPVELLVRPAVRIDARELCGGDPSWVLRAEDLEAWEAEHGASRPAARCSCARAGTPSATTRRAISATRWTSRATAAMPPCCSSSGRRTWLGIDTLSVDAGAAADFPVHHTTLPAGFWHLEGLVGLDALPDVGATVVVGALKLPGSSGTPARVLALLP